MAKCTITCVVKMKLPFKIKEIKPSIFLFEFTNQYDMCMHFLRYQEFYESPNPKFRRKSFTILDFMKWQAEKEGNGNFTYPTFWTGFNVPSNIFLNCIRNTPDFNIYDKNMTEAFQQCSNTINDRNNNVKKYYIIGALKGSEQTVNHELAHGTFYLNSEYKKEATKLVKALPVKFRKSLDDLLTNYGYTKQVFVDEINAFLSTDTKEDLITRGLKVTNQDVKFKELFDKFVK